MLKRTFDVCVSFLALVVLSPLLLTAAILVRANLGLPVLFRQRRPGYKGRPFTIYKFRTMRQACDKEDRPLPDELRMTPLGRFLRRTSIDELPELFNVLKGDMSLVGPRPLLMSYLDRYTPEQHRRHDVKPGITGWAQIKGRNAIDWDERFALDLWYVANRSFRLDLEIIAKTVAKTLNQEGIHQQGHVSMPEYNPQLEGHSHAHRQ